MARVVIIVDSITGALTDVAGHSREDSRYLKFVKRMLSLDRNPVLDYGGNGGDTLEISKGGAAGTAVNIKADTLNVSGEVKSGGQTISQISDSRIKAAIGNAIDGISVGEDDTLEDIRSKFSLLLENLNAIVSASEGAEGEQNEQM